MFDLLPFEPDRIIVAYGTNDVFFHTSLEVAVSHMIAYLDRLRQAYREKRSL